MLPRVILVGWALFGLLALSVADESHDFEVADEDGIYFGEGKHPKSPAVCTADDVWEKIPEYKQIQDEELDEDDPKYHLLLAKATERFRKALEKIADRDDYDMVGEVGSIRALGEGDKKKEIPDVTEDLVDFVTRD